MRKLFLISTLTLVAFGFVFGAQKGSVKAKKQKMARTVEPAPTMFNDGGLRLGSSLVTTPSSTRLEIEGVISSSGELYANNQLVVSSSGAVMTGYGSAEWE